MAVLIDISAQFIGPIFSRQVDKEDEAYRLSPNVGQKTTIIRFVTSQKSADLIYTVEEIRNCANTNGLKF